MPVKLTDAVVKAARPQKKRYTMQYLLGPKGNRVQAIPQVVAPANGQRKLLAAYARAHPPCYWTMRIACLL